MFNRLIRQAVNREIEARLADIPKPLSPQQGYNTAEAIRGGMFHWLLVPVNNSNVWMELRTSNATQLDACGAISLVEKSSKAKEASEDQIIEMRNSMEEVCKVTMNNPTFDEFIKIVTDSDFVYSNARLELERLKAIDCTGLSATEKDYIDTKVRKHELHLAYLLPENTMDFIVRWAMCLDVSDIKKISEDKLLEAAILAKNGNKDPTDHLSGVFTDRDKTDLNKAAWAIYNDYMTKKDIEKNTGRKWLGGK